MSWLELFSKLDFEDFLETFPLLGDIKPLYDYVHALNGRIKCLYLKVQDKRLLKSGYYWYMVLLSNLTCLETLIISDDFDYISSLPYKNIIKGLNNFKEQGGKLKKLILNGVEDLGEYKSMFKHLPDLESLQLIKGDVNSEAGLSIGKLISENKNFKELDFFGVEIYNKALKNIADGLMRAKNIEVLKLRS